MIHITPKALIISPYLSTSWDNIASLFLHEEKILVVCLKNNSYVQVPHLTPAEIDQIYKAHAHYLNSSSLPLAAIGPSFEHNPEQANLPPLPPEVLAKVAAVAKTLGVESLPMAAEPHCNCTYCQVVRSFQQEPDLPEEEVTDEDLKFRNWDVAKVEEKLYIVTNPLDSNEYYRVFLGSPVGCTCGKVNCEHIRAVLEI